nr:hypothetical protein Iba_chr04cCG15340 [Ipomoea batatas]
MKTPRAGRRYSLLTTCESSITTGRRKKLADISHLLEETTASQISPTIDARMREKTRRRNSRFMVSLCKRLTPSSSTVNGYWRAFTIALDTPRRIFKVCGSIVERTGMEKRSFLSYVASRSVCVDSHNRRMYALVYVCEVEVAEGLKDGIDGIDIHNICLAKLKMRALVILTLYRRKVFLSIIGAVGYLGLGYGNLKSTRCSNAQKFKTVLIPQYKREGELTVNCFRTTQLEQNNQMAITMVIEKWHNSSACWQDWLILGVLVEFVLDISQCESKPASSSQVLDGSVYVVDLSVETSTSVATSKAEQELVKNILGVISQLPDYLHPGFNLRIHFFPLVSNSQSCL